MGRIGDFFTQKGLKPRTRQIYTYAIRAFFKYIYGPDAGPDFEDLAEKYLAENRDFRKDLIGFIGSLRNRPPGSVRTYYSGVIE
jgi:hypothetical protein